MRGYSCMCSRRRPVVHYLRRLIVDHQWVSGASTWCARWRLRIVLAQLGKDNQVKTTSLPAGQPILPREQSFNFMKLPRSKSWLIRLGERSMQPPAWCFWRSVWNNNRSACPNSNPSIPINPNPNRGGAIHGTFSNDELFERYEMCSSNTLCIQVFVFFSCPFVRLAICMCLYVCLSACVTMGSHIC